MIVVLTSHEPPRLADLDRLDRLHAEVHGGLGDALLVPLCEPADDDHIWLDIVGARAAGVAASDDPAFGERFDAMIVYAGRSGWIDEAGERVRAHIEPIESRGEPDLA